HESIKPFALDQLLKGNPSNGSFKNPGLVVDDDYIRLFKEAKNTVDYSKYAYLFYIVGGALLILHFVFKNNKWPDVASAVLDLSIISFVIYTIYYAVTWVHGNIFYKHIELKAKPLNVFLMLIGFPFYGVSHFLLKNRIKEDLDRS